jgi:hypothetical protein
VPVWRQVGWGHVGSNEGCVDWPGSVCFPGASAWCPLTCCHDVAFVACAARSRKKGCPGPISGGSPSCFSLRLSLISAKSGHRCPQGGVGSGTNDVFDVFETYNVFDVSGTLNAFDVSGTFNAFDCLAHEWHHNRCPMRPSRCLQMVRELGLDGLQLLTSPAQDLRPPLWVSVQPTACTCPAMMPFPS